MARRNESIALIPSKHEPSSEETPDFLGGGSSTTTASSRPPRGAKAKLRETEDARDSDTRTTPEGLHYDDIEEILRAELDNAIEYTDGDLADRHTHAMEYYRGDITRDVPDEEGRSKATHRVFHDTVKQIAPALVEVFLGSEHTVEFVPNKPGAEEEADQRTEYVTHCVREDNDGFTILLNAITDALILRTGILKWGWDERITIERQTYTGLTEPQMIQLLDDEDITDGSYEETGTIEIPIDADDDDAVGLTALSADGAPPQQNAHGTLSIHAKIYTVRIRREKKRNRLALFAVPGEEFLRSRDARTMDDSGVIAHRRLVTRSDLIAMGFSPDDIDEWSQGDCGFYDNAEFLDREPDRDLMCDPYNFANAKTLLTESYIRLVRDPKLGIAELCRVFSLGWQHRVKRVEDADHVPFAALCPWPMPHKFEGEGPADDTMDAQRIMSMILRSTLESLAQSIHPRTVADPNKVNMADVLNTEIGGVVRGDPTAITPMITPFVGRDGLVMLDWWKGTVQERTGILAPPDPAELQSTNKKGIDLTERASTQQITFIARVLANTGFKRMYQGIQRTLMLHQDIARTIRLRGKWVTVDPATWNAEMDVTVSVGMAQGTVNERLEVLEGVRVEMYGQLTNLGLKNPLSSIQKYGKLLQRMSRLSGFADPSVFWNDIPADWEPPEPPKVPTDAEILAQSTMQKAQIEAQSAKEKLEFERWKAMLEDERERFKIEMAAQVDIAKAQIAATKDASASEIEALIAVAEMDTEREIRLHESTMSQGAAA